MTTRRRDGKGTDFSNWLRFQKSLDSENFGYRTTDIDYIWRNSFNGKFMLIEEKREMGKIKWNQKESYMILDNSLKNDPDYCGAYLVLFENQGPEDGHIYLTKMAEAKVYPKLAVKGDKEISKKDFISFLEFKHPIFGEQT